MKKSFKTPPPFALTLPATSANLGPAFDAAALALKIFLKISAHPAHRFSIRATGRDSALCGRLENNLILDTYCNLMRAERKVAQPLALKIYNQIPIGKGCGSSAAARLAGIALAIHWGKLRWEDSRIIGEAARLEGHADNAAACWMGGLTVARLSSRTEAQVAVIQPKGKWPLLIAVPTNPLATEEARKALPDNYSRADAVTNLQNSMLLLAAFSQGRPDLLTAALEDRIHQPYRAALCPLLPALQPLTGSREIVGVALSGAGPSVLIFLHPKAALAKAQAKVAKHLRTHQLAAELIPTSIFQPTIKA